MSRLEKLKLMITHWKRLFGYITPNRTEENKRNFKAPELEAMATWKR